MITKLSQFQAEVADRQAIIDCMNLYARGIDQIGTIDYNPIISPTARIARPSTDEFRFMESRLDTRPPEKSIEDC